MTEASSTLFEVFVRSRRGLDHRHVGSMHAEDHAMALQYARDVYTRRSEGEGPGEFDSTETWTDLRPVTVTGTAGPVLAGRWELIENPNDAGVAAGCSFGSNTGWVIFVPTAAVG